MIAGLWEVNLDSKEHEGSAKGDEKVLAAQNKKQHVLTNPPQ